MIFACFTVPLSAVPLSAVPLSAVALILECKVVCVFKLVEHQATN